MTNLKINSTSTPYWCVVVPVDAEDLHIYKTAPALEFEMYGIEYGICLPVGNYSILGCITSSGMDEGAFSWAEHSFLHDDIHEELKQEGYSTGSEGDTDKLYDELKKRIKSQHLERTLSLLTHNQITLTADQKAVIVKQIT